MKGTEQIDRIQQHFAGNDRVVFDATHDEDGHAVVYVYVDHERAALMYPTVESDETRMGQIIWGISSTLDQKRAALEAELRERIAALPLQALRTMLRTARETKPRHMLALYSVDAEGSHADEAWPLSQIVRSNPDSFSVEDLAKLRTLPVGHAVQFEGGAWATFVIKRES